MNGNLDTPISNLSSVGKTTASRIKKLGLNTVLDLLYFFPARHDDFTKKREIKDLEPGENANVVAQIELIENRRAHRRKMNITEALVNDGTESLKVIWFNQPYLTKNLAPGDEISLAGRVDNNYGVISMISPIYEKITKNGTYHTAGLVPVYRLTEGLTQKQLRFLIKQSLDFLDEIEETLPEDIIKRQGLLSLTKAIEQIHFPKTIEELESARKRLAFDELFLLQLKSQIIKKERENSKAEIIKFNEEKTKEFVDKLPFKLTDDQKKATWQALKDMEEARPMSRLLNGDVGSGKTMVASIIMLNTVTNKGLQTALMAPTEILATQHFESISKTLKNTGIKIGLVTGSKQAINTEEKISKAEIQKQISAGNIDIIIGTHSLVSEKLKFKNLALAVIDEQHRFGVAQRKALIEKSGNPGTVPHLLSMTATPIPRSLSLALFGDLDISFIKEMPSGRKKIITQVLGDERRNNVYKFIREQINADKQVFVICPLIEESDSLGVKSVQTEYKKLNEMIFPEIEIAMLHGKMKSKEKEEIMNNFLNKKFKILVSTSVVEVGVDIQNATIIAIEGAERFGLAQLHQFRGRVGRGTDQSYCILFTDSRKPETIQRLKSLEQTSDGFKLAQLDMQMRGSGDIYGVRQKGFPEMKIATLSDHLTMQKTQEEAEKIIKKDPELSESPSLRKLINKSLKDTHLE